MTRVDTGKSVTVVSNDRGLFVEEHVIDLSKRAARKIDILDAGVVEVELRMVGCKSSTKSSCDQ